MVLPSEQKDNQDHESQKPSSDWEEARTSQDQSSSGSQSSSSSTAAASEPSIAQPKENHRDRIAQDVKGGRLTAGETSNLEAKEAAVINTAKADPAANDSKLIAPGKNQINGESKKKFSWSRFALYFGLGLVVKYFRFLVRAYSLELSDYIVWIIFGLVFACVMVLGEYGILKVWGSVGGGGKGKD